MQTVNAIQILLASKSLYSELNALVEPQAQTSWAKPVGIEPVISLNQAIYVTAAQAPNWPQLISALESQGNQDDGTILHVFYTSVYSFMAQGLIEQQPIDALLTTWKQQTQQLIEFYKTHRQRCHLVEADMITLPSSDYDDYALQYQLNPIAQPLRQAIQTHNANANLTVQALAAHQLVAQDKSLQKLMAQLEACSDSVNDVLAKTCDVRGILDKQAVQNEHEKDQLAQQASVNNALQTYKQQLLQQLHQAQEQLESTLQAHQQEQQQTQQQAKATLEQAQKQAQQTLAQELKQVLQHAQQNQKKALETQSQELTAQLTAHLSAAHQTELAKQLQAQQHAAQKEHAQHLKNLEQQHTLLQAQLQAQHQSQMQDKANLLSQQSTENELIIEQLHLVQEQMESEFYRREQTHIALKQAQEDLNELQPLLHQQRVLNSWLTKQLLTNRKDLYNKSRAFRSTLKTHIKLINNTNQFDQAWYLQQYPDVAAAKIEPVLHYLLYGALENRHPSPVFNTFNYLIEYTDVAKEGMHPLLHFIKFGQYEGRKPDPLQKLLPPPKPAENL